MDEIDYTALEEFIYAHRMTDEYTVHGIDHWHQVEFNGLLLAKKTNADETVIRLFSLLHDSCRMDDGYDKEHGARGAELAKKLRGDLFNLDDARFEKLIHACANHTIEPFTEDATIDSCYDADRLDLGRVGMTPSPAKMATVFGKKIAKMMADEPVFNHRKWIKIFAERF